MRNTACFGCLFVLLVTQVAASDPAAENPNHWQWQSAVQQPPESESPWADFLLVPEVFTRANVDLSDLRVRNQAGRDVPYALRFLREQQTHVPLPAEQFDRSVTAEQAAEVSLDLGDNPVEHNRIEVQLPGDQFRRRATLEGSPDRDGWRQLAEGNLLKFEHADQRIEVLSLSYPPSRYRYLRLRVEKDPAVDDEAVQIGPVRVSHRVSIDREDVRRQAAVERREFTRHDGAAATAWIIDLDGDNLPVDRLEVEFAEEEFVREYVVQYAAAAGQREWFETIAAGTWRRRPGDEPSPMVAEFEDRYGPSSPQRRYDYKSGYDSSGDRFVEIRTSKLRLLIVDHANPPLTIRQIHYAAPAYQVVLPRDQAEEGELRLYYGNPDARSPHYEFGQTLSPELDPPPARTTLGPQRENPDYDPIPPPLSERWPPIVYVAFTLAAVVLGGIIVNVARAAIRQSDSGEF